jgi:hypothetical protein
MTLREKVGDDQRGPGNLLGELVSTLVSSLIARCSKLLMSAVNSFGPSIRRGFLLHETNRSLDTQLPALPALRRNSNRGSPQFSGVAFFKSSVTEFAPAFNCTACPHT